MERVLHAGAGDAGMVEKKTACWASSYASILVPLSWNIALVFDFPELIYGTIYTNIVLFRNLNITKNYMFYVS